MAPRRPSSSFGLIAVSTMAMVFAVSSSLLLFSAHRHHRCRGTVPVHTQNAPRSTPPMLREAMPPPPPPPVEHAEQADRAQQAQQAKTCGTPVYRSNADGSQEVRYELCTPPAAE